MLPLSSEPMRSSNGNSVESIEQPFCFDAQAADIRQFIGHLGNICSATFE
jgi:hypothetical protein